MCWLVNLKCSQNRLLNIQTPLLFQQADNYRMEIMTGIVVIHNNQLLTSTIEMNAIDWLNS